MDTQQHHTLTHCRHAQGHTQCSITSTGTNTQNSMLLQSLQHVPLHTQTHPQDLHTLGLTQPCHQNTSECHHLWVPRTHVNQTHMSSAASPHIQATTSRTPAGQQTSAALLPSPGAPAPTASTQLQPHSPSAHTSSTHRKHWSHVTDINTTHTQPHDTHEPADQ